MVNCYFLINRFVISSYGAIDCPSVSMQVSMLFIFTELTSHIMKMFLEKNKSSMNITHLI